MYITLTLNINISVDRIYSEQNAYQTKIKQEMNTAIYVIRNKLWLKQTLA